MYGLGRVKKKINLVDSSKTITNKPFGLSLSKACISREKRFDKLTANGNCFAGTVY